MTSPQEYGFLITSLQNQIDRRFTEMRQEIERRFTDIDRDIQKLSDKVDKVEKAPGDNFKIYILPVIISVVSALIIAFAVRLGVNK